MLHLCNRVAFFLCSKLPGPGLDAEVHSASIGPPVAGGHDERVVQMAREMGIPLQPVGGQAYAALITTQLLQRVWLPSCTEGLARLARADSYSYLHPPSPHLPPAPHSAGPLSLTRCGTPSTMT